MVFLFQRAIKDKICNSFAFCSDKPANVRAPGFYISILLRVIKSYGHSSRVYFCDTDQRYKRHSRHEVKIRHIFLQDTVTYFANTIKPNTYLKRLTVVIKYMTTCITII